MGEKAPYHRGIRGSAALATRPLHAGGPAAEALEPGEMRRVPYSGELLGAVRVRASYAALPLDAFDRLGGALEAVEQAAYLHLLRLSVGEGRNWCRVAKRDLLSRLHLSERRLLRVLDALVAKGFARPLHRDNRGTLWRVSLPREAFGERLGDDVLVGKAARLEVVAGPVTKAATSTAAAAPPPVRRPRLVHSAASLARALAAARGVADAPAVAAALREVNELLAEGHRLERIAACIDTVRRRAARAAPGEESP